jgi:hypothetical protein
MKKHIKRTHKLKPKNQGLILKQLVNQNHEIKNQKDQIHMNLISLVCEFFRSIYFEF